MKNKAAAVRFTNRVMNTLIQRQEQALQNYWDSQWTHGKWYINKVSKRLKKLEDMVERQLKSEYVPKKSIKCMKPGKRARLDAKREIDYEFQDFYGDGRFTF